MSRKDLNAAVQKATAGFFSSIPAPAEEGNKSEEFKEAASEPVKHAAATEAEEKSSKGDDAMAKSPHEEQKHEGAKDPMETGDISKSKNAVSRKGGSVPSKERESSVNKHVSLTDTELGARLSDHGEKELRNIRKGFLLSKKAVANLTHLADISGRKPNDMINFLLENIFDLIK